MCKRDSTNPAPAKPVDNDTIEIPKVEEKPAKKPVRVYLASVSYTHLLQQQPEYSAGYLPVRRGLQGFLSRFHAADACAGAAPVSYTHLLWATLPQVRRFQSLSKQP